MKTIAVFKWCKDPQDARLGQNDEVIWGSAKLAPSDDDPAAVELAKAICDDDGFTAVTIGDGDTPWCAARGAQSTISAEYSSNEPDGAITATAIVEGVQHAGGADVIVIGDSDWNYAVVSALASRLGIPAIAGVTEAQIKDGCLLVTCRGSEASTIVSVKPPVLLAVKGLGADKSIPGMKQVLQGRKKPLETIPAPEIAEQRIKILQQRKPEGGTATIFDSSDTAENVTSLLEALRADGAL